MKKPQVVIVDNSHDACRIYEDTLNSDGYEAVSVWEEEKALDLIKKMKPAVVLLDILMPRINGIQLLDLIQENDRQREIDVIILTNVTDSKIREQALNHGAKDYIVKTEINMKDLLKRIDKVIAR